MQAATKIRGVEGRQQRLKALLLEDGSTLPCSTLVALAGGGVDPKLFGALNDESLVFDGRLVVDASFKTNDPKILAGGELVKFVRRIQVLNLLALLIKSTNTDTSLRMQDERKMELFNSVRVCS